MNEKIKQLISQSYEYAVVTTIDPFTEEVVTDYIDGTKPIFNKEKFAELIVRECSRVIVNGGYLSSGLIGPKRQYTPPEIAQMIKEHFGVEE